MKIKSIRVKNFRAYKDETTLSFDNLTLIIGKNDIGKSTMLEAADIFFGNRKVDKDDLSITCDPECDTVEIAIEFVEYPEEIDIDAGAKTNLKDEHLLNGNGNLEVKKVYKAGSSAQPKILLRVVTPANQDELITKKNADLKRLANELKIEEAKYNATVNNSIRKAIWSSLIPEIEFTEKEIEINKEDGKKIYEKLELEFPIYTLFSADRKNTDQDDEIQSPVKASIKELVAALNNELEPIKEKILGELDHIADGTIKKLSEMNPDVAKSLKAVVEKPAWEKAFSVNIESDGVPLNKRGSGVKRLVLINFFRHEAERKSSITNKKDVFYAIEEPETSQHPDWQIKLFDAFKELSQDGSVQIAMTSHHPELSGLVDLENIRLIQRNGDNVTIKNGNETNYQEISQTLGIVPKLDGVKVIVGLEGPTDIEFIQNISEVFGIDPKSSSILWVPLGGGTVRNYVDRGYLEVLNLPQVYLFDRDKDNKYSNDRDNLRKKGHWAELTDLLTTESYLHPMYYRTIWSNLTVDFVDLNSNWIERWVEKDIPRELSAFITNEYEEGNTKLQKCGSTSVKKLIAKNSKLMMKENFDSMGTFDELNKFFEEIKKHL